MKINCNNLLQELNSPRCFDGNGTFECGICTCNPNRYGENCECDEKEVTSAESEKKCMYVHCFILMLLLFAAIQLIRFSFK
jgi:hypothetical protein